MTALMIKLVPQRQTFYPRVMRYVIRRLTTVLTMMIELGQLVDPKYAALLKHCNYVDPDDDTSDGTLGASSTDSDSWDDTYKQRSMNFRVI